MMTAFDSVYFISDLHLGHPYGAKCRGFASVEEHDELILDNLSVIPKKAKVFFLGDIMFRKRHLESIKKFRFRKEAVLGNHDELKASDYLTAFHNVRGFFKYKNFWISHAPIHPQEIYRARGNIHGHIHNGADTPPLPMPYFNVNVDFNDYKPVPFSHILETFDKYEKELNDRE